MFCILSIKGAKCNNNNPVHVLEKETVYMKNNMEIKSLIFLLKQPRSEKTLK